jgi:hypothetical protein
VVNPLVDFVDLTCELGNIAVDFLPVAGALAGDTTLKWSMSWVETGNSNIVDWVFKTEVDSEVWIAFLEFFVNILNGAVQEKGLATNVGL